MIRQISFYHVRHDQTVTIFISSMNQVPRAHNE